MMKMLVVCQDSLDPIYYERYSRMLPNSARVFPSAFSTVQDNGVISTWPIWTTFATGVPRNRHGINRMCKLVNGKDVMWTRKDIPAGIPIMYQQINNMGLSVGWYGLPVTATPVEELNGFMVSDRIGVTVEVWPKESMDLMKVNRFVWEKVFDHRGFDKKPTPEEWEAKSLQYAEAACEYEQLTTESFIGLCRKHNIDVGFVYYDKLDRVGHQCADNFKVMSMMYRNHDEMLGRLVDELSPEIVVVISDHGMGPVKKYITTVNFPLHENQNMRNTYLAGNHRNPGLLMSNKRGMFVPSQLYRMTEVKPILLEVLR